MGNEMDVNGTMEDALADNKKYYECPSCKQKVWAYGSFVGEKCLKVCLFH